MEDLVSIKTDTPSSISEKIKKIQFFPYTERGGGGGEEREGGRKREREREVEREKYIYPVSRLWWSCEKLNSQAHLDYTKEIKFW